MMQMMGGAVDASYFERPEIRRQIVEQLVNEQVLLDANEKLGIRVPDERVRKEILGIAAFQKDGKFDSDTYKMLLIDAGHDAAFVRRSHSRRSRRAHSCQSRSARRYS